jgi:hypothetical protein
LRSQLPCKLPSLHDNCPEDLPSDLASSVFRKRCEGDEDEDMDCEDEDEDDDDNDDNEDDEDGMDAEGDRGGMIKADVIYHFFHRPV